MLPDPSTFQILETTTYTRDHGVFLLDPHLARMRESARRLSACYNNNNNTGCFDCSRVDAENVLETISTQISDHDSNHTYRVRMLLSHTGELSVQVTIEPPSKNNSTQSLPVLVLDSQPSRTDSVFVQCKTTHRTVYTDAAQRIPEHFPQGTQVLLYNECEQITEGNIANVAVSMPCGENGQLVLCTPPVSVGLLPGTMRQHLLDTGQIREAPVSVAQFRQAVHNGWPVMCMNSVRGLYAVTPVVCVE
ncbi:hypothetical protein IWW50_000081 [Coemansia erecta]|nr:hypothetical protein GGF43_000364 [Coemansia sp. RSA 2618]KAJ2830724.1 hypothetical protein IWW50_000081 [Coemansia erecta]